MHDIEIATHTCHDGIKDPESILRFITLMQAAGCSHKLCADSVKLFTVQLNQIFPAREEELIAVTLEHSCLGSCRCMVIINCLLKIVVGQQITFFLNGYIWVECNILSCSSV